MSISIPNKFRESALKMLKRIARLIFPRHLRRWLQHRKLEQLITTYSRRVVQHRYGDITLKIELRDGLAEAWYDHDWELPLEIKLLRKSRLIPGARVFDLGAHQGIVGLMLAHEVGPSGQVVLIEPSKHNLNACDRNIELNEFSWVVTQNAAVSNFNGSLEFARGLNGQAGELSDYAGLTEVLCVTVDRLTDQYGVPDVIFVDVEGFECRVLSGANDTFTYKPDWFIEVHVGHGLEASGGSVEEVFSFFPLTEYECFVFSEGDKYTTNLLEVSSQKLRSRFFLIALRRKS